MGEWGAICEPFGSAAPDYRCMACQGSTLPRVSRIRVHSRALFACNARSMRLRVRQHSNVDPERWVRMNITTTFRQMAGTDAVKNYAQEKVAKLQKFLR